MATPAFAEEELGRKWDRCLTDTLLKMGGGVVVGGMLSMLFFKRRRWPLILGAGFGVGLAYSNCERDLNSLLGDTKLVPPADVCS